MKIVSFIPIKLNNQRLPNKNIMPLNGRPLCDYLFQTLGEVENVDEKYVFCSDEAICPYIPDTLTFLKREKWLDGPEVRGLTIIENFVKAVDADIYVLTHVTSPFMKRQSFEKAIEAVKSGAYDSAFSADEMRGYCWYQGKPVNYSPEDIVVTQDLEPLFMENGGFFIFRKEVFTEHHRRIGFKPFIYFCDRFEGVEIDTRDDFDFAFAVARYLEDQGQ
jgi:CMP-N-acetylneuraminic acid synthetase